MDFESFQRLQGSLPPRSLIAACAAHRCDPGDALPQAILQGDDGYLRARAIKAVWQLGRVDLIPIVRPFYKDPDARIAFPACFAGALLAGEPEAIQGLQQYAQTGDREWNSNMTVNPEWVERAIHLAVARLDPCDAWAWIQSSLPHDLQLTAAAAMGTTFAAKWLLGQGEEAADAIMTVTGLSREEAFEWEGRGPGVRHLLGQEITTEWLWQVLREGKHPHRALASYELAMLQGGPCFEFRAPASRQLSLLSIRSTSPIVRVVVISDTHNASFPDGSLVHGDLLIHCGDHTMFGSLAQTQAAALELDRAAQKYRFGCVAIMGNHDEPFDRETWDQAFDEGERDWDQDRLDQAVSMFTASGAIKLLCDESVEIGGVSIFGTPWLPLTPSRQRQPIGHPRRIIGFSREDEERGKLFENIPSGVDILITHSPPFGVLDLSEQYHGEPREKAFNIGDQALLDHLAGMPAGERPKLNLFGHEHDQGGKIMWHDQLGMWFANCSCVDMTTHSKCLNGYQMRTGIRPVVVDVDVVKGGIALHPGN
eukprot:TRINITY_DN13892_c0_g1_i1.p1 TRINITY_DN13892_c0_g1~~TRINITY_DN13892_c0_g1_i1.p1  ORF type:complete len:538 (+),score=81.68 TRINITY_DN13892_c0_g1_i1:452-2065(+)